MGGCVPRLNWTRRYTFQSVHNLNLGLVEERRHGHQYFLEVTFSGRRIDEMDKIVNEKILSRLHARELHDLSPSTGEHIVDWIHEQLLQTSAASCLKAVALQETRKNRFVSALSDSDYV